jgi:hypothetical protein
MFPPGGFPSIGPTPGSQALDGTPPSPTPMSPPPGGPGGFSMQGIAGGPTGAGGIPASSMPPEVLTGLTQSMTTVAQMLDAAAQVTPDQAAQLGLIKDLISQYLATVMQAGAGPVSPTAGGPAFPGGGMDRGIAGPGSV